MKEGREGGREERGREGGGERERGRKGEDTERKEGGKEEGGREGGGRREGECLRERERERERGEHDIKERSYSKEIKPVALMT